jgi:hypothetical protein
MVDCCLNIPLKQALPHNSFAEGTSGEIINNHVTKNLQIYFEYSSFASMKM